jgi:hypothetical protein
LVDSEFKTRFWLLATSCHVVQPKEYRGVDGDCRKANSGGRSRKPRTEVNSLNCQPDTSELVRPCLLDHRTRCWQTISMSRDADVESGTIANEGDRETEPLLGDREHSEHREQQGHQEHEEHQERRTKPLSWYLWRMFWTVVATVCLAVFVKGWIDAGGDVDFDLSGALKRALGGGLSGAAAMVLQVLLLMVRQAKG